MNARAVACGCIASQPHAFFVSCLIDSALRVLSPLAPQLSASTVASLSASDRDRLNQRIAARCDLLVMCKRISEAVLLRLSCDSALPAPAPPAPATAPVARIAFDEKGGSSAAAAPVPALASTAVGLH